MVYQGYVAVTDSRDIAAPLCLRGNDFRQQQKSLFCSLHNNQTADVISLFGVRHVRRQAIDNCR